MAMSDPLSWTVFLQQRLKDDNLFRPETNVLSDKDSYISAVEKAAQTKIEKDIQKELNSLGKIYIKVEDFAEEVGERAEGVSSDDLLTPVWNASFSVIETSLSYDLKLCQIVKWIADLHEHFPKIKDFRRDLGPVQVLQKPLQDIFISYITGYQELLYMISEMDKSRGESGSNRWRSYLDESASKFKQAHSDYRNFLVAATEGFKLGAQKKDSAEPRFIQVSEEPVAHGAFGVVYEVREQSTQDIFALKKIRSGPGESQISSEDEIRNEIKIMKKLNHHHITTLAFATEDIDGGFSLYIRPFAEHSLGEILEKRADPSRYQKDQIYRWFGCLAGALAYAHRSNIKHKDIKPNNILIDEKGDRILLTDFGVAMDFSNTGISTTNGPRIVGTPKYHAPECIDKSERTEAVDIFALGCVYAEMLNFIIAGRSLTQFDLERKQKCDSFEFKKFVDGKKSNEALSEWIKRTRTSEDKKGFYVLRQLDDMLAVSVDMRPTARTVTKEFIKREGLSCNVCSL